MSNDAIHPALSAEFLSRLHDGELAPAERAHFESHRAHCADCRSAAAAFEAALSLFRASTTSPPPPDLAARILRKLGTGRPRRSPFGTVFGINLTWAAASAIAVIAVIVGSTVVSQRNSARKAADSQGPISVLLGTPAAGRENAVPPREIVPDRPPAKAVGSAGREEIPPPKPASPPSSAEEKGESSAARQYAAAPEDRNPAAEQRAAETRSDEPAPRSARKMAAAPQTFRSPDAAGGEGAATSSAASPEPGAPARLVVVSLDGQGKAPEIVSAGAAELLSDQRGRQFVLLVSAEGRVREARTRESGGLKKRARARDALENAGAPSSVRSLRFRPTDRARRLLLRVE